MRPILEWLQSIEDPTIREKAIKNWQNDGGSNSRRDCFANALMAAFDWSGSPEGLDYWADCYETL